MTSEERVTNELIEQIDDLLSSDNLTRAQIKLIEKCKVCIKDRGETIKSLWEDRNDLYFELVEARAMGDV